MTKDIILGLAIGALLVLVVLIGTGKLTWQSSGQAEEQVDLRRYIEMHEPTILEFDGATLLSLPVTQQQGNRVKVNHKFYVYKDGKLVEVPHAE